MDDGGSGGVQCSWRAVESHTRISETFIGNEKAQFGKAGYSGLIAVKNGSKVWRSPFKPLFWAGHWWGEAEHVQGSCGAWSQEGCMGYRTLPMFELLVRTA